MRGVIFVCVVLVLSVWSVAASGSEMPIFVPTCEWQPIAQGQSIPAGLEIRVNLAEHTREARKTCEGVEPLEGGGLVEVPHDDAADGEFVPPLDAEGKPTRDIKELIKIWDEVMSEFEDRVSIMKRLIGVVRNASSSAAELVTALEDLEDMSHHVDNANDIQNIGGWPAILELLHHGNETVRLWAAWTIGSAAQNNPTAQQNVADSNGLRALTTLVRNEPVELVKRRGIYALSALLRHSGPLQDAFLDAGGLTMLSNVVRLDVTGACSSKIYKLVGDILQEAEDWAQDEAEADSEELKVTFMQKSGVPWDNHKITPGRGWLQALVASGWCRTVDDSLRHRIDQMDIEAAQVVANKLASLCAQQPQ